MKLKILFWLKDGVATEAQITQARLIGAQFRNAEYAEDGEELEKADYVMGDVPKAYQGYKLYKAPKGQLGDDNGSNPGDNTGNDPEGQNEGPQDDEEGEEITVEYINGLKKAELIDLAGEESITLVGDEKVDDLKKLIIEHFELQE